MDPSQQNQRHVWYVTPFDELWARKLGASAQLTSGTLTSAAPTPVQPALLFLDDNETSGTPVHNDTDGAGTFNAPGAGWVAGTASGYKGDYRYHSAPTVASDPTLSDTAQWSLTVPVDGWYSVQATWPTDTGRTLTAATFQVAAPGFSGISVPVVQNNPGNGIAEVDVATGRTSTWWALTTPRVLHLHQGNTVTVTLNVPLATLPNTFVIADAVRLIQNEVTVTSIKRSFGCKNPDGTAQPDVTAAVSVTAHIPQ
jgi:hypothetical protein